MRDKPNGRVAIKRFEPVLSVALREDAGKKSGQILCLEYAAAQIVMDAISRAGSTETKAIVDALAASDHEFAYGPVKFAADHAPESSPVVAQWQGGTSKRTWPAGGEAFPVVFPMP